MHIAEAATKDCSASLVKKMMEYNDHINMYAASFPVEQLINQLFY